VLWNSWIVYGVLVDRIGSGIGLGLVVGCMSPQLMCVAYVRGTVRSRLALVSRDRSSSSSSAPRTATDCRAS